MIFKSDSWEHDQNLETTWITLRTHFAKIEHNVKKLNAKSDFELLKSLFSKSL